jgi:glutamine amidotransferase
MCELFAMASRWPTTVRLSLDEFARHGSLGGPHHDGWGVAWYAEGDVQLVREPHPAENSACMAFLRDNPFTTTLAMSQIRHATQGAKALRNCQPFARELGGRMHLFAHNGDVGVIDPLVPGMSSDFRAVGDTDSERAFCLLLDRLRPLWRNARQPPLLDDRIAVVARFAADLRPLGPANFLYSDGDALYAHGHRRRHGDVIRPPGLHVLARHCPREAELGAEGLALHSEAPQQEAVLVASVPLTAEAWAPLAEGELIVAQAGRIVARVAPPPHQEL